ncbi:MAG: hemoglobin [Bacteroidetes bacterium]|nr:hemoglobin [Bacteroidota bacterium]
MMNQTQINLVKKSWRIVRQLPPSLVADTFYSKLFLDHSELRKMFPKNMDEQYRKLMDMLSAVVARLDNLDVLQQDIADMAKRHVGYGVQAKHYAMVGSALLWTLEKGLGSDWNEDTAKAWTTCYGILADSMMTA